jgi:acyl transferase domain-containing protein
MARAAAAEETGMTAVLGGAESEVLAAIEAHGLTPANINAPGQIVAAGTRAQLDALAADPPAGARLRPLSVAGAFHSPHMAPAVDALRAAAAGVTVTDPAIPLLSNLDGAAVASGADWLERIITQVSAPVRWADCMRTMADLGTSAFIELLPGGTLTGLARRALPGVATVALKTPDDLTAARSLLAEHGAPDPFDHGHLPGRPPRAGAGAGRRRHLRRRARARGGADRPARHLAQLRRHHHRVAGRGRGPGQRGPAPGQAAARGSRVKPPHTDGEAGTACD